MLNKDDDLALSVVYEWLYVGRNRCGDLHGRQTLEALPDYIAETELHGQVSDPDAVLRRLRDKGMIVCPEEWLAMSGKWELPDGRILDAAYSMDWVTNEVTHQRVRGCIFPVKLKDRDFSARSVVDPFRPNVVRLTLKGIERAEVIVEAHGATPDLGTAPSDQGRTPDETDDHKTTEHVADGGQARASKDFSSVRWYGQAYTFTKQQAMCVSEWWDE